MKWFACSPHFRWYDVLSVGRMLGRFNVDSDAASEAITPISANGEPLRARYLRIVPISWRCAGGYLKRPPGAWGPPCPCRANWALGRHSCPGGPPEYRIAVYGREVARAALPSEPVAPQTVTYSITGRARPARWAHDGTARKRMGGGGSCGGGRRRGKSASVRAELLDALAELGDECDSDEAGAAWAGGSGAPGASSWAWDGVSGHKRRPQGPAVRAPEPEWEVEAALAASRQAAAEWEEAQLAVALAMSLADAADAPPAAIATPAAPLAVEMDSDAARPEAVSTEFGGAVADAEGPTPRAVVADGSLAACGGFGCGCGCGCGCGEDGAGDTGGDDDDGGEVFSRGRAPSTGSWAGVWDDEGSEWGDWEELSAAEQ